MREDIKAIYLSEEQIKIRVEELAKTLSNDYKDEEVVFVVVMKGGMVFASDLLRHMEIPVLVETITAESYGMEGTESQGIVKIKGEGLPIEGKHVVVIEDMADTGLTLSTLVKTMEHQGAKTIRMCVAMDKPSRRQNGLQPHYIGFTVEDYFLVGYGLDYKEKYRQLPYIAILKEEVINEK